MKISVYRQTFIMLISILNFFFIASCKSPTSPEPEESFYVFTYGLYDDFESGTVNAKLWDFMTPYGSAYIRVKDDGSGNRVLAIKANINDVLHLTWPNFLYPDEFYRMSAKAKIFPSIGCEDFGASLSYVVKIPEQGGLNWTTHIGIRRDPSENIHFYAEWRNWNTDRVFHRDFGIAELKKWYKLELKMTKIDSVSLEVEYCVNDEVLAESIPEDSSILLDHDRIEPAIYCRSIRGGTLDDSEYFSTAWFDEIYGVFGDRPANFESIQSFSEAPLLFKDLLHPNNQMQLDINRITSEKRNDLKSKERRK